MLGWRKHKLESRLSQEISITSDMQVAPPLWSEIEEELKSLLMKLEEESEKVGFKLNIQKTKIVASGPITLRESLLGRLIRSPGVPKERGVWNSQGGEKDKLFFPSTFLSII